MNPVQLCNHHSRQRAGFILALALTGLLAPAAVHAQESKVLKVGAVKTLFRDLTDTKVQELTAQFAELMHKHTGLSGAVHTSPDAFALADDMEKGKLELGLLQGFEFAWVQEKFPKLKPLMIAVNYKSTFTVHVVTRKDGKIANFADLKGKPVSLPLRSGGHSALVMDRLSAKAGTTPDKFFSKLLKHESIEDSLDDVVRATAYAAVVDSVMLEAYALVKPGAMALLKTIEKSEPFPAAAVVYREGTLPQKTLDTLRDGLLKANKDAKSKGMMALWRLTAFEPVPTNYQQSLDKIRTAYPAS
jgi:ABC-type phosphate/phosphonate transport system substrate-binding protein